MIPVGNVLHLSANHRLTYLSDGKAKMERLHANRLDKSSPNYGAESWIADEAPVTLTEKQTAFWLSKI